MTARIMAEAKRRGFDGTLTTDESHSVELSFEFNRLKGIQDTESISSTLQVVKGGRLGVASSTLPDPGEELVDMAASLAAYGAPVSHPFPSVEPAGNPVMYHQEVADLPLDKMLDTGEDMAKFLKSLHPDVNGALTIIKTVATQSIGNTAGLEAAWRKTTLRMRCSASLVEGQNLVEVYKSHVSTGLDFGLPGRKEEVRADFELARRNVPVDSGTYDVLFTAYGFADVVQPILECLNGKAVVRGISPLAGRLGEQAFSPSLTIVEDGTLDDGPGSRLYDREGVACRRTALVDAGFLREYLLDLDSARRLGRKPIGAGGIGDVAPNNIIIMPGIKPKADMIAGLKRGIIIDVTMGAWAGNPYGGQVSGNIGLGYLVEDGKRVGRVKDCMFSLNAFKHLKDNLVALSRETAWVRNMLLPCALIRGVSVSAKKA